VLSGTVSGLAPFAQKAEFVRTHLVIPLTAIIRPDIEARLGSPASPIRFVRRLIPVRVGHRTVFDAFIDEHFPNELGLGVGVNALPTRPHVDSVPINKACRLHRACK